MGCKYAIIGKGGLYHIIREIMTGYDFLGYYDDKNSGEKEWLGKTGEAHNSEENVFIAIAAIRNMFLREKLLKHFLDERRIVFNAISSLAYISPSAVMGYGNILSPFVCIHSGTTIGNGCIFFSNSVVEHDCIIGDNCNAGPGVNISGSVNIGRNVFIGAGSILKDGITVGNNTIIGAGSVVLQDLPSNIVAYGHPSKPVRKNDMYKLL